MQKATTARKHSIAKHLSALKSKLPKKKKNGYRIGNLYAYSMKKVKAKPVKFASAGIVLGLGVISGLMLWQRLMK